MFKAIGMSEVGVIKIAQTSFADPESHQSDEQEDHEVHHVL